MDNYFLNYILRKAPDAFAYIRGSNKYPGIRGNAKFFVLEEGIIIYSEVNGLPFDAATPFRAYAYHIHNGDSCSGNNTDPFSNAGEHYNPDELPHPYHAGDLPPLFGNYGYAWNTVFTARFKISEVIKKPIIIHINPDDFVSQPSGNSGEMIACGIIERASIR